MASAEVLQFYRRIQEMEVQVVILLVLSKFNWLPD
jgi:hypothetical protein